MKKITLIAMVWTLALAGAGCSASRSAVMSEADIITARQIGEMLDEHLYKFDFDRAYPMSAPSFPLSSPYYVSVIGDRVESFLPYFSEGRTTSAMEAARGCVSPLRFRNTTTGLPGGVHAR